MADQHYFSPMPSGSEQRRTVQVRLAGRDVRVQTAGGVFSPDGVDKGTRVLLDEAPPPPRDGAMLDLGCGWGAVALALALLSPAATVYAVDVNERSLRLTRDNAAALGCTGIRALTPEQVPAEVRFTTIWSNPPIRIGKAALHDLLRTWLPRLEAGGAAYLVVSKNLGADSLARWIGDEVGMPVVRHATSGGFRVLRVDAS